MWSVYKSFNKSMTGQARMIDTSHQLLWSTEFNVSSQYSSASQIQSRNTNSLQFLYLGANSLGIGAHKIYFSLKIISDKLYLFLYLTLPSDKLHNSIPKATETEHPVFSSYTQPCAFKKFHIRPCYGTELCHLLSLKPQYHLTAGKTK